MAASLQHAWAASRCHARALLVEDVKRGCSDTRGTCPWTQSLKDCHEQEDKMSTVAGTRATVWLRDEANMEEMLCSLERVCR